MKLLVKLVMDLKKVVVHKSFDKAILTTRPPGPNLGGNWHQVRENTLLLLSRLHRGGKVVEERFDRAIRRINYLASHNKLVRFAF